MNIHHVSILNPNFAFSSVEIPSFLRLDESGDALLCMLSSVFHIMARILRYMISSSKRLRLNTMVEIHCRSQQLYTHYHAGTKLSATALSLLVCLYPLPPGMSLSSAQDVASLSPSSLVSLSNFSKQIHRINSKGKACIKSGTRNQNKANADRSVHCFDGNPSFFNQKHGVTDALGRVK